MKKFKHSIFDAISNTAAYKKFATNLTSPLFAQLEANLTGCSELLEATQSFQVAAWKTQQEHLTEEIMGVQSPLVKNLSNEDIRDVILKT